MKIAPLCLLSLFIALAITPTQAQTINEVKKDYTKFKEKPTDIAALSSLIAKIDKVATTDSKSQTNAEFWLYKFLIYGRIASIETLSTQFPNSSIDALEALKKYLTLDPSEEKIKQQGLSGLNEVYMGFFNKGMKFYKEKNWKDAQTNFKYLTEISDTLIRRKWANVSFDTVAYALVGASAQYAQDTPTAVYYYKILADKKINAPDYVSIYEYLVSLYYKQKNETDFYKYLNIGKTIYPDNKNWNIWEFNYALDNASIEDLEKKYTQEDTQNKLSAADYFDYAATFFRRSRSLDSANIEKYVTIALQGFEKSYSLDTANIVAAYNCGIIYSGRFEDLREAYNKNRGATPALKAKREAIELLTEPIADLAIKWLEEVYKKYSTKTAPSRVEKNNLTQCVNALTNLFEYKANRAKALGKTKEYDTFNQRFLFYNDKVGK